MIEVVSPFPLQSLPRVWRWIQSFRDRVSDDYSPQTLDAFVEKALADAGRLQTWAVYRDGELGGMVSFERWTDVLGTCHCLFKREMWGRKTTLPALQQIAGEIFAGGTTKIAMCVFSDNRAIKALIKDLGGVTEGQYRKHTMRGGQLVDMTALALFKEGFEAQHASTSNSGGDRGSVLAGRRSPGGPVETVHADNDAELVTGDAGPAEEALGLQLGPAHGSGCRDGAD
jgi:RimJ/RimL family protein N-acetyltransferase